jgi:hypothetical protein
VIARSLSETSSAWHPPHEAAFRRALTISSTSPACVVWTKRRTTGRVKILMSMIIERGGFVGIRGLFIEHLKS